MLFRSAPTAGATFTLLPASMSGPPTASLTSSTLAARTTAPDEARPGSERKSIPAAPAERITQAAAAHVPVPGRAASARTGIMTEAARHASSRKPEAQGIQILGSAGTAAASPCRAPRAGDRRTDATIRRRATIRAAAGRSGRRYSGLLPDAAEKKTKTTTNQVLRNRHEAREAPPSLSTGRKTAGRKIDQGRKSIGRTSK